MSAYLGRAPNILLITTDQQRPDSLGCSFDDAGLNPNRPPFRPATPHLDRLASEGLRFREAHAPAPVCSPSRTSLATGLHVPAHGVFENGLGGCKEATAPIKYLFNSWKRTHF